MEVIKKGSGKPEIAVVYCTHGDETAGKKAVEMLLDENPEFRKAVKFVFANRKAYEKGERFIDTDLNRSFPGDPGSENYEERLAARMMEELKDQKVLDLHETEVSPTPFSLFTGIDKRTIETVRETNTEKAVEISYTPGCGINNYGGVEVETGPKGTEKSIEEALKILKQFLINNQVLKGEVEKSNPEIFSVYSEKQKPRGEWKIKAENFERLSKGEIIAESKEEKINAEEEFSPVLFGESYSEIFGFKSVRLEKVEDRIFNRRNTK